MQISEQLPTHKEYQLIIGVLIGGVLFGLPMGLCVVLYKLIAQGQVLSPPCDE